MHGMQAAQMPHAPCVHTSPNSISLDQRATWACQAPLKKSSAMCTAALRTVEPCQCDQRCHAFPVLVRVLCRAVPTGSNVTVTCSKAVGTPWPSNGLNITVTAAVVVSQDCVDSRSMQTTLTLVSDASTTAVVYPAQALAVVCPGHRQVMLDFGFATEPSGQGLNRAVVRSRIHFTACFVNGTSNTLLNGERCQAPHNACCYTQMVVCHTPACVTTGDTI